MRKEIITIIAFIKSQQQLNGSFLSFTSAIKSKKQILLSTTFTTALILASLKETVDAAETKNIIDPAVNFLLSEKNPNWSWNYWTHDSANKIVTPYPNDWDDTACALIALSLYKKELITPEVFGAITKLLVATESKPGGPYYTWLFNEQTKEWEDIDPVVNANIGYFLKLHDINLLPLEKYIEEIITTNNYTSRYYHTPEAVIYFISRYYSGPLTEKLSTYLLNHQNNNGVWENDLLTSLAASSLLRANTDSPLLSAAINHLTKVALNNSWQAYPLYIESHKETTFYNSAPALTAAFALEALTLWDNKQSDNKKQTLKIQNNFPKDLQKTIINKVKKRLTSFPKKNIEEIDVLLDIMLKKDPSNQITLLPYFFLHTLKPNALISNPQLITLGEVNLYGWLAYTIYDNIMDYDSGPELLSIANTCLRELVSIYKEVLSSDGFALFQATMDIMEQANAWENVYFQLPKEKVITKEYLREYPNELLYDKSLPHAFGPISILLSFGYEISSIETQQTLSFFKNYLAARQLNDDAHDWQEDVDKGFLNSVSSSLLHTYFKNNPNQTTLNLPKEKQNLQKLFWESHISTIAEEINTYIKNAQTNLDQLEGLHLLKDRQYFETLLIPLQLSVQQININKQEITDFLDSFQS